MIDKGAKQYLCSLLENKSNDLSVFDNLNEYKKFYMKENKNPVGFGGSVGVSPSPKDRKDDKDYVKYALGDTSPLEAGGAYALGKAAGFVGDTFLSGVGAKLLGKGAETFGKKLAKGFKLGGIDVGRQLLAQIKTGLGAEWVDKNTGNIAAGMQQAYAQDMGSPFVPVIVPGRTKLGKIEPEESAEDRAWREHREKIAKRNQVRQGLKLGINPPSWNNP